jgi:CheY-like chemotaxis protein
MVGQSNGRVLLVDDEPLVRNLMSGYLVAAGYVVRVAVDGLDAIGKLRAGPPDLIISDLEMPRMSGRELLNVVRKRFPQIPVIALRTAAPDQMPEEVAADAYFHKNGFEFEQLLQCISDLIRKPPLRTPPPHVDNRPAQARWDTDGHYIIDCEDCLRTFSIPRAANMGQSEKWTVCVHCGRAVHFFVADGDLPGPAQP